MAPTARSSPSLPNWPPITPPITAPASVERASSPPQLRLRASAVPTRDMRARAAAGTLRILRIVGITGSCGARLDAGPSIVEPLMDRPR